jgi:RNA polymerase sigma-70 factor (ECF subfamily)
VTAPKFTGNDPPQAPRRLQPVPLARPQEDLSPHQEPVADDAAALAASLRRPELFALVFDRHAAQIRSYCARRVGQEAAEDLVGEVFLTAFEKRARFDPARAVAPWLFGIATNLLRRSRRQELRAYRVFAATGRDPVHGQVVDGVAERAAERADADRLSRSLAAALAAMPAPEREVLLLLAWANLGYAEIAQAVEVPVGTVRSRLSRARARLRAALPSSSASDPLAPKEAL